MGPCYKELLKESCVLYAMDLQKGVPGITVVLPLSGQPTTSLKYGNNYSHKYISSRLCLELVLYELNWCRRNG